MKTGRTKTGCGNGNYVPRRTWKAVAVAIIASQLAICTPAMAEPEENTSGVLKSDRAEYMKATSAGQAKAEPTITGNLCSDAEQRRIEFRSGEGAPAFTVSYDSIKSLLYEPAAKPRYPEAVLISPLFLLSHAKKYFLPIQYADSTGASQVVMVHLDKNNAREAIAAAESQTGKAVERVEER